MARLGAGIAGPTWLMQAREGWTIAIPTFVDEAPVEALAAAISGAVKRRERVLLVWGRDRAFGLQVWRGGKIDVSTTWGTGWETVAGDPLALEAAVVSAVTPLQSALHLPSLRALLRRRDLDEQAAASLLDLLGLPDGVASILHSSDAPEGMPGAELVPKMTPGDAAKAVFRSERTGPVEGRKRPFYLAYAVGTALAALVCLAMTGLSIAVLITDGAIVDQAGATGEDRLFLGIFVALSLVLIPTAVHRLRRVRRRREPERQDPS
jgi:hypothetical protein